MKYFFCTTVLALVTTTGLSQPTFRKGYFLDDEGKRTEAEIRIINDEWTDNPKTFEYRLSSTDNPVSPDISSVKEIGFAGGEVFRRLIVQIDRSRNDVGRLSRERNPEFHTETLFLRLQVDGKALLYKFDEGILHRFFYSIDGAELQQLVYKRYLNNNGDIVANENYKQQLFNDLKCKDIEAADITSTKYDTSPLTKLFVRYNKCIGSSAVTNDWKKQYDIPFRINLRPGVTFNSMQIKNTSLGGGGTANMDNVGFRLGIELDVALPFGEGLWSGLFEPAYQTFSGEFGTVKAKYTSIDLHLGLRRYFPVGKGRLYLNSSLLYSQPSATLSGLAVNADVSSTFSLALSAGYKANRLSMELYFAVPRNITRSSSTYQTTFGGPAVILGYALK